MQSSSLYQATFGEGARIVGVIGVKSGDGVSACARSLARQPRAHEETHATMLDVSGSSVDGAENSDEILLHTDGYEVVTLHPHGDDLFLYRSQDVLRQLMSMCMPTISRSSSIARRPRRVRRIPCRDQSLRAAPTPFCSYASAAGQRTRRLPTPSAVSLVENIGGVVVNRRDQVTLGEELARQAMRASRFFPRLARGLAQRFHAIEVPRCPYLSRYSTLAPTRWPCAAVPVRICVDSSGIGGIERHIAVLAAGLRRDGHDARILLLDDHGPNPWLSQLDACGAPYDLLDGRLGSLFSLLKKESPALLHTHGYKAGLLGRLAARLAGTPVISTFHAGETDRFPSRSINSRMNGRVFLRRASASASRSQNVCLSPRRSFQISSKRRRPAPDSRLPNGVGFVGRLSAEKGPEVFCALAARHPDELNFAIYGDGFMRPALEAEHGGHIAFHGMVTDIAPAWRELGLLVISSYAEGLPMVALEALAAGVPVAATAVGALPEIIRHGENGWLFQPGDVDALDRIYAEWSSRRLADGAALGSRLEDGARRLWRRSRPGENPGGLSGGRLLSRSQTSRTSR